MFAKEVERSLALDQDSLALELAAGEHLLVFKVVNAGGDAGFAWAPQRVAEELTGDLAASFLPASMRSSELEARLERGWRTAFSPGYRERAARCREVIERSMERAPGPELVARAILHALSARRPRLRYAVGREALLVSYGYRWLPERVGLRLIRRHFGV